MSGNDLAFGYMPLGFGSSLRLFGDFKGEGRFPDFVSYCSLTFPCALSHRCYCCCCCRYYFPRLASHLPLSYLSRLTPSLPSARHPASSQTSRHWKSGSRSTGVPRIGERGLSYEYDGSCRSWTQSPLFWQTFCLSGPCWVRVAAANSRRPAAPVINTR